MKDGVVIEAGNIREAPADPGIFTRPPAYRHQKPVIGAPGWS